MYFDYCVNIFFAGGGWGAAPGGQGAVHTFLSPLQHHMTNNIWTEISCLLKSPYLLLNSYLLYMFVTMDLALTAVFCLQPGGAQQGYPGGPAPGQPMPNYPGTNPSMPGYGSGAPSNPQAPAISVSCICLFLKL